jgi:hypothetical protein
MIREGKEEGNSEKRERGGRVKGTGSVPGVHVSFDEEEEANTMIDVIIRIT